jgi:hypothetical protein
MALDIALAWLRVRKELGPEDSASARGFFQSLCPRNPLLSRPRGEEPVYVYPLVQFKALGWSLLAVGIQKGADFVEEHCQVGGLVLGGKRIRVWQCLLQRSAASFGHTSETLLYRFLTPWVALNKENYRSYKGLDSMDAKMDLLGRVLVGNILTASKGVGVTVDEHVTARVVLDEVPVTVKGEPMRGFVGNFSVNFDLPDYVGLGKGASLGFGTVRRR